MPDIKVLDPHVADLIAAGEVVERPASVVKELMENAIDAGATALTVEIQHGGMTLIRVTDDGCGIPAGQTETAFLRHATSKVRTEYDLEAIGTLGFRGEALAAISAVSRVELLTRTAGADLGASVSVEGGVSAGAEEAGCPKGTTIVVRDLFFNTPARLKFMKKDAAEGAAVFAAVQREALAHPEVSVKFIRDGRQELLTPGDSQVKSAVYSVFGRDLALGLTPVKGSGEDMTVEGFTSLPTCCRGTRGYQYFFVNGRHIKSRTMMAAVEEAYQNQKMVGKFPGCVLYLTTKLNAVDVNVHPAKTEVKFTSEKKVFDAVYYAVKSALEGDRTRPAAALERPKTHDTVTPNQTSLNQGAFRSMTAEEYRKGGNLTLSDILTTGKPGAPIVYTPPRKTAAPAPKAEPAYAPAKPAAPVEPRPVPPAAGPKPKPTYIPQPAETFAVKPVEVPVPDAGAAAPGGPDTSTVCVGPYKTAGEPVMEAPVEKIPAPVEEIPWRLVGEVLNTYIIVEQGDKVLLIDKHAAHERMNFDRLKAAGYTPMVQSLLAPVVFTPPAEDGAVLLAHAELLERFGFTVEDFGGGSLAVRECPDDLSTGEIEPTLLELANVLLTTGRADPESRRDELLHTMACKAAIKGGQKNDRNELETVARAVMAGEVRYCPHGRPVAIELTRNQLEKQFKRA